MDRARGADDGAGMTDVYTAAAFVGACSLLWFTRVHDTVPNPYLDEVFHVRQAQVYCSGDLRTWDPKITTPPGLYLISYVKNLVFRDCSTRSLRAINPVALVGTLFALCYALKSLYSSSQSPRQLAHTAANICLFPPLFFFSALYYTDVASVLFVLLSFINFCDWRAQGLEVKFGWPVLWHVSLGLLSLWFRQTNVFWVGVFPAGLVIVELARRAGEKKKSERIKVGATFVEVVNKSWKKGLLYDPAVIDAWAEDYVKTVLSIAIVTLLNLRRAAVVLLPHVFLIASFGAFVAWNGGVVLGDKSNHVATLHLPQMLYLWPYMMFFSFPLMVPQLLGSIFGESTRSHPRVWIMLLASIAAAAAVHFNTIVHPFTLADNRHYVFYVFRLLLRHPAIKYLAAPAYVLCSYLTIQTLGGTSSAAPLIEKTGARKTRQRAKQEGRQDYGAQTSNSCRATFVIVWTATTALSLITAPLVEPRYCIIPWIIWRLHVPSSTVAASSQSRQESGLQWLLSLLQQPHSVLLFETIWFGVINFGTGYLFLYRGFTWEQEPGNVQRFMW